MADPATQPTATVHDPNPDPAAAAQIPAVAPGVQPAPATASTATDPDDGDEPFDKARAMALIEKLRLEVKEAKAGGRKAAELEQRLREIEDANLTEQQRVEKERDDLKAEKEKWEADRQETNLRLDVYARQQALGIADADLAIAALNRDDLVWENGHPINLTTVLEQLLDAKPLLRGAAAPVPVPNLNAGGGQAATPQPALTADELQAAQTLNMSPEEYAAFKGKKYLDEFAAAQQATATQ